MISSQQNTAITAFGLPRSLFVIMGWTGLLILAVGSILPLPELPIAWWAVSVGLIAAGVIGYSIATYAHRPPGIKNDHVWLGSLTGRGLAAWGLGIGVTGFYVLLYFYPAYLGLGEGSGQNSGLIALFDPLSQALKGQDASQWFVYGVLYTLAILVFGIKFIYKYRHNPYQRIRTWSVIFFQLGFAFLIPEWLLRLNYPYNDFKNMWPLNYYFFDEWNIEAMTSSGTFGLFMILFGVAMIFIISPILTYYYGKRWYCSWVCGCGGLAETAGDPFRHLSDPSKAAWRVEKWLIHSVLVFSVVMTGAVLYSYLSDDPSGYFFKKSWLTGGLSLLLAGAAILLWLKPSFTNTISLREKKGVTAVLILTAAIILWALVSGRQNLFFVDAYQLRSWYGFLIGATFSGVIGVGFYPIMGSRVWCRFGCPMAAILGIQQKFFSRFRITTNGGQCISCGNCTTYCEMGIDVRAYAQEGKNIVRASCVGCGICAAVCPRGVLRLENGRIDLDNKITADY